MDLFYLDIIVIVQNIISFNFFAFMSRTYMVVPLLALEGHKYHTQLG